ncbi:hypothetical protein Dsin_015045 [Dipteronia sinensis]|uniref:R13L1/DRL21-like LRR repeat region domain-containing protein n=1 Tax=Dipteronia sinensis TaxID=43782 RepID=A0AAE0ANR8_9ROSI|nr:hypothetical protein Dsin_015045 [Dipteronia sinensis]
MADTVASPRVDVVCDTVDSHARALSKNACFRNMRLKLAELQALLPDAECLGSDPNSSLRGPQPSFLNGWIFFYKLIADYDDDTGIAFDKSNVIDSLISDDDIVLGRDFDFDDILTNFRNLGIESCRSLLHMPLGIRKLRLLRRLLILILGKRHDCTNLQELRWLDLVTSLDIKNLENVNNLVNARKAKLHENVNINSLELSWSFNATVTGVISAQVLEVLRPALNLEVLCVKGYRVEIIGCEFYGNSTIKGFPSLQQLELHDMPKLLEWKSLAVEETVGLTSIEEPFPCLEKLIAEGCCVLNSLPSIPNLKNLALCNNNRMLLYSLFRLHSLSSLVIDNFQAFNHLHSDYGNGNISSVMKLTLHECDNLETLFGVAHIFPSVRHLSILHCGELCSLTFSLNRFRFLQKLDIVECRRLFDIIDIPLLWVILDESKEDRRSWSVDKSGRFSVKPFICSLFEDTYVPFFDPPSVIGNAKFPTMAWTIAWGRKWQEED